MISRELFSIRVQTNLQTMEMTSWWRNLLPFFLAFAILREMMDDGNGRQWKLSMSFWKKKSKLTHKSTAIFHGLYSYRPKKWRQNVQNFALEPLADKTSRLRFFEKLRLWNRRQNFQCYCEKLKQNKTNKQINSNFPWSVLLSTTEMTSKCSKLCGGTISRHIIWESYLSLLSCVVRLCFGGQSRNVPGQSFLRKENNKAREWRYVLWSSLER